MISIISTPKQISSAFNQMLYEISSDKTSESNFSFVADVYVSGFTGMPIRLTYPKQPNGTHLQFDIQAVIKNYVSYDFIDSFGNACSRNQNSQCHYYVQFGEIYDASGSPTLFANEVQDPSDEIMFPFRAAINTVFDFQQSYPTILDAYDVSQGKFLNTACKNYWAIGQKKLYSFLDKNRIIDHYNISFRNSAGAEISSLSGALTLGANCNIFNLDLTTLLFDTVPANTVYFILSLLDGGVTKASYTTYIDTECSQFQVYRLHWLNQLGGFDTFNFKKATDHNIDVERKQYKKIQSLGNPTTERLKTNYNTSIVDKFNTKSDWLTDDEGELIATLVESPLVFLENPDGSFVAINVTNSSYEIKKWVKGRALFFGSIDFEYTYNRIRQQL